jgi:hypothetical protein
MPKLEEIKTDNQIVTVEAVSSPEAQQVNAASDQMKRSIVEQCKLYGIEILCDDIPDFCNAGSALLTVVLPEITSQIRNYLPNKELNSHYWNLADSMGLMLKGFTQLFLEESTFRTKVHGVTNIVNGTSLGILTIVSETLDPETDAALTSAALAVSMGVTFLLACEEIRYAARRRADVDEAQRRREINSAIRNAFYTGSLFFGTAMLCKPSEETQIAAVILLSAFTAAFFTKEIMKIGQCVSTLFHCNKNANKHTAPVADDNQTPHVPLIPRASREASV